MRKCDICLREHYAFSVNYITNLSEPIVLVCFDCETISPCEEIGKWRNGKLICPHGVKYTQKIEKYQDRFILRYIQRSSSILFKLKSLFGFNHIACNYVDYEITNHMFETNPEKFHNHIRRN